MLQGNPYETEKWVEDRTRMIQHGVEQQQGLWVTQTLKRVQKRWPQTVQDSGRLWWLPAAVAFGALLSFIFGGWSGLHRSQTGRA
jgi:hypothetical protein